MNKIHQLSPEQAQKIAAGEVIERPANIVKELIENSLDAGATKISVYVERGGKQLIRVVDNGCGMSPEDAHICCNQFATSKITHVQQLPTINTFGFRGEALASIAAVSALTLITKEATAQEGYRIDMTESHVNNAHPCAANTGTDITITHLFATIPARKKFLKADTTETHHIEHLFTATALAHLHVEFKLYSDGTLRYNCPPTEQLLQRYTQLFDHTSADHMLTLHHEHQQITVRGLISHHQYQRYDRSGIYLFVNQRWIKDVALMRAIMRGYNNVLQPARFPAATLFIDIDAAEVDINTHPRKEEIRFMHPRVAETAIQQAVTNCLQTRVSTDAVTSVQTSSSSAPTPAMPSMQPYHIPSTYTQMGPWRSEPIAHTRPATKASALPATPSEQLQKTNISAPETLTIAQPEEQPTGIVLAQLYQTYIMIEQTDALVLIDQHAAHERIIYEQLKRDTHHIETIELLFPLIIQMQPTYVSAIEPYIDQFAQYGIRITVFGIDCLSITTLPIIFKDKPIERCIHEIVAWIVEHQTMSAAELKDLLHGALLQRLACAAAVKAGDTLNQKEMESLVTTLATTTENFCCPHGRPTTWTIPHTTIIKQFKRDYRSRTIEMV